MEESSSKVKTPLEDKETISPVEPAEDDEQELDSEDSDDVHLGQDDPIEDAYELEQHDREEKSVKAPLSSGGRPSWAPKIKTADEFFSTEILYRFDILEPEQREQMTGSYYLQLTGKSESRWMISIEKDINSALVDAPTGETDVTFKVDSDDFIRIINGQINAQLSLLSQKVKIEGSPKKAFAFQCLLAPSVD